MLIQRAKLPVQYGRLRALVDEISASLLGVSAASLEDPKTHGSHLTVSYDDQVTDPLHPCLHPTSGTQLLITNTILTPLHIWRLPRIPSSLAHSLDKTM